MKKACISFIFIIALSLYAQSQVTYSQHIAAIFYDKCTSCHHAGAIAPFPLDNYTDAYANKTSILNDVTQGIMPPWHPDTTYSRFSHERILSQSQKQAIVDWVNNGAPEGNPALTPPPPVYPVGSSLGTPDLGLRIPTYTSTATSIDQYRCFVIPSGTTQAKYIKAMEVVPGNRAIVHHVQVYVDTSNIVTSGNCSGLSGNNLRLIGGYVPGSVPNVFPNGGTTNMGVLLPAGKNIVVQIHYPAGTAGQLDSTAINFFFYPPSTPVRPLSVDPLIQFWGLSIPADSVKTYKAKFPAGSATIPANYSLIGIMPHMHLIGQSMVVYAVDALNDTTNLIRIKDWDFHWQGYYQFRNIIKLTPGSKLYATAVYDNTTNNPQNPNNPPQLVVAGEQTSNEMFMCFFQYLPYLPGDENIDLDTMMNIPTTGISHKYEEVLPWVMVFPNPANQQASIQYGLPKSEQVNLKIVDAMGREIKNSSLGYQQEGIRTYNIDAALLNSGVYFIQISTPSFSVTKKMQINKTE